jgi:hypothetical protein
MIAFGAILSTSSNISHPPQKSKYRFSIYRFRTRDRFAARSVGQRLARRRFAIGSIARDAPHPGVKLVLLKLLAIRIRP